MPTYEYLCCTCCDLIGVPQAIRKIWPPKGFVGTRSLENDDPPVCVGPSPKHGKAFCIIDNGKGFQSDMAPSPKATPPVPPPANPTMRKAPQKESPQAQVQPARRRK